MLAVVGGSGLYELEGLAVDDSVIFETPFGRPSGPVVTGTLGGGEVAFISRHGADHSIVPHLVNYRANLTALQMVGASRILAVCTVGGISDPCVAGAIVVPDQIIDYTWGREQTFAGEGRPVVHIDFTSPFAPEWRRRVIESLVASGASAVDGGVCAVNQGPRLETAAEVRRLAGDGCDVVGMTMMPEAALARELGIDYAAVCPVANKAAGLASETLDVDEMAAVLVEPMEAVKAAIANLT